MSARLLIVEDNDMNRDMLSRYLALFGYELTEAGHATEVEESIRAARPDLILMDVSLPDVDGCEITRRLKQDAATRDIPVIALTAHAMSGDRERCLEAGCDEYETKPVDIKRLTAKIDALLGRATPA